MAPRGGAEPPRPAVHRCTPCTFEPFLQRVRVLRHEQTGQLPAHRNNRVTTTLPSHTQPARHSLGRAVAAGTVRPQSCTYEPSRSSSRRPTPLPRPLPPPPPRHPLIRISSQIGERVHSGRAHPLTPDPLAIRRRDSTCILPRVLAPPRVPPRPSPTSISPRPL